MAGNKNDLKRVGQLLKQLRNPNFRGDKSKIINQLEGLGLSMGARSESDLESAFQNFQQQSASFDLVFDALVGRGDTDVEEDEVNEVVAHAQAVANAQLADRLDEASRQTTARQTTHIPTPPKILPLTPEQRSYFTAPVPGSTRSEVAKVAKVSEQLNPPKDSAVVVAKTVTTPTPVVKEPRAVKSQELSEHVPSFFDSLLKVAQDFFIAVVRLFGFLAQEPAVSKGKAEEKASASGDAYQEYISSHASMRHSLGSGIERTASKGSSRVVDVGLVSDEFITASRVDAVKPQADVGRGIELTSYPRSTKPEVSSDAEREQNGLHKGP